MILSRDIGIDLGTATTMICDRKGRIIVREPSVVAVDVKTKRVVATGTQAKQMIGRTPGSIVAVRPLKNGVIADFDITAAMLQSFIRQACGSTLLARPRVVICVPSGVTEVERRAVRQAAAKALESEKPLDIINKYMIPALDFVGRGFEKKTLFLPQLLMSADAAKAAFEVIREAVGVGETQGETVIIATVHGDIHDIGKNIVKVLLENYGYRVLDLGKDVPVEAVVEAAKKTDAKVVGLSALMTTTVGAMEETIAALHNECDCQVVVGGAVLTQEYADTIGAEHYAPNAVSAVNYVNEILGK